MAYLDDLLATGMNDNSEELESAVKKDQVVDNVFARANNGSQCVHGEDLIINDYIRNARIG